MSSEQALREHFDASNRRDFPTAMSYYDDDVVCVSFRGIEVGSYYGIAWVYWMRSGKIVRVEIHDDLEFARRIAGMEPL